MNNGSVASAAPAAPNGNQGQIPPAARLGWFRLGLLNSQCFVLLKEVLVLIRERPHSAPRCTGSLAFPVLKNAY